MAVEERNIEVTILSGSGLKKVKKFGFEQKCFAEAYVYPSQKQHTKQDLYDGVNPNWNEKLTLTCFESHIHPPSDAPASSASHALTVNVLCKSSGLFHHDPHLLGTVTIPLRDIGTRALPDGVMKSYDLHQEAGDVQGSLFLSVKLGPTRALSKYQNPSASHLSSYSSEKEDAGNSWYAATLPAKEESHMRTTKSRIEKASTSTSTVVNGEVDDDVVMGYPSAPVYTFDPLDQMGQRQARTQSDLLGAYSNQNQERSYDNTAGGYPINRQDFNRNQQVHPQHSSCDQQEYQQTYNDCRRCERSCGRDERRRKCGRNRRGRRGCPVRLVRMMILGPIVMGLRQLHRHIEQK